MRALIHSTSAIAAVFALFALSACKNDEKPKDDTPKPSKKTEKKAEKPEAKPQKLRPLAADETDLGPGGKAWEGWAAKIGGVSEKVEPDDDGVKVTSDVIMVLDSRAPKPVNISWRRGKLDVDAVKAAATKNNSSLRVTFVAEGADGVEYKVGSLVNNLLIERYHFVIPVKVGDHVFQCASGSLGIELGSGLVGGEPMAQVKAHKAACLSLADRRE